MTDWHKPSFWDTPRGIGLIVVTTVVVTGVITFVLGFEIAQIPPTPIEVYIHFDQGGNNDTSHH